MLKRKPIPPFTDITKYNNNNLHEYDPYILSDNRVIIDKEWYSTLTDYCQNLIRNRLENDFELDIVTIPHVIQIDNSKKVLNMIYTSYLESFDYNIWYDKSMINGPQNVQMLYIPSIVKKIFSDAFQTGSLDMSNTELLLFKNEITNCLKSNQSYFIRLSSTSGKNEKSLKIFHNADEIIKHLISNKLFVFQEYDVIKDTYLIIIPWNDKIDERCEFRLFYVNKKLTGASIQKWWELIQHSIDELELFQDALSDIKFVDMIEYQNFIVDVYVDSDTKMCHLIEINPFGAHCGAGSSLFNWITDYDILHGMTDKKPQLRYLSAINY